MKTLTPRYEILPPAQRELCPALKPLSGHGYVLYGGTAIALQLGHRHSVDFDFFSAQPLDRDSLRQRLPFLADTVVRQDTANTLSVQTRSGVQLSFFGNIGFGHINEPRRTSDGVLTVASLDDLFATKVKTLLQRTNAKDYQDVAAMIRAGVPLDRALAAAEVMFHPTFSPAEAVRALVYFKGGDLDRLSEDDRALLRAAVPMAKSLPGIQLQPGLGPADAARIVEIQPVEDLSPPAVDPIPGEAARNPPPSN